MEKQAKEDKRNSYLVSKHPAQLLGCLKWIDGNRWESKDLKLKSAADVAERVSLRVEYQTLRRLPKSRYAQCTVQTYLTLG